MRAPTLMHTARLGGGKLLPKISARAATLPPIPTEKDSFRATDTQELVAFGKMVDDYSELSNTSTADAARLIAAYSTTKYAAIMPYVKEVISEEVRDLKEMLVQPATGLGAAVPEADDRERDGSRARGARVDVRASY
jgi:hypothetical protein